MARHTGKNTKGAKSAKMNREPRVEFSIDRFAGRTPAEIQELLQIELDALHIWDEENRPSRNDHTSKTIAARLQALGIECDDAMRLRFAAACEAIGHNGTAWQWFVSLSAPKTSRAFRAWCLRHAGMEDAEKFFAPLTRAEYSRLGRSILQRGAGLLDKRLLEADKACSIGQDAKGLALILREAIRVQDMEYIRLRVQRPLRLEEKKRILDGFLSGPHSYFDADKLFTFIREHKLGDSAAHVALKRLCSDGDLRLETLQKFAEFVECTLTTEEVELYLKKQLSEFGGGSISVSEIEASIDWLVAHGVSSWEARRLGIMKQCRSFLLTCSNLELLDAVATKAGEPLTPEEIHSFIVRRDQHRSSSDEGEKKRREKETAFLAQRIAKVVTPPSTAKKIIENPAPTAAAAS